MTKRTHLIAMVLGACLLLAPGTSSPGQKAQLPAPPDKRDIKPIADMIRQAGPGAVITIPSGSYNVDELSRPSSKGSDNVSLQGLRIDGKQGLTLKAGDGPVAFYSNSPDKEILQIANSKDIVIDGLSVFHQVEVSCLAVCISVDKSENVTIRNSDIHGSGAIGIALSETRGVKIQRNKIHNCSSSGVFSGYGNKSGEVSGNTFSDNGLALRDPEEKQADTRKYDIDIEDQKNYVIKDNKFLPMTPVTPVDGHPNR